jgi:hypothetical protein
MSRKSRLRPALPQGIEPRRHEAADADPLRGALNEAFADDPFFHEATPASFRAFFLEACGFGPSLRLLAWDGAELAGFQQVR